MADSAEQTPVVSKIENRLSGLAPGTLRYQVLQSLRDFRASWVELGLHLNEVVYGDGVQIEIIGANDDSQFLHDIAPA